MYTPIIRLNTNTCKICNKTFKNEKALKDHIFNRRVNDEAHILFKEEIRNKRFENAKLICPVCQQKIFKNIKTHFNGNLDEKHNIFLKKQNEFFIKKFLNKKSCSDILKIKNKFTNSFSLKYTMRCIVKSIGRIEYDKISKDISSKKRQIIWSKRSPEEKKKIMEEVRKAQWGKLTLIQKRNHPWVIAGRKSSLESSKRGSKNQKYAYDLLIRTIPEFDWKYNYLIGNDWQIDIACPEKKIFVEWDGRHHRVPIHGNSYLNNRKNRDRIKDKIITNDLNGLMIRVKDDSRANLTFVKQKVQEIKRIIHDSIGENKVVHI